MAITKNNVNEMLRTVLVLSASLLSAASAVDCNGKSFHCVNSTHFMICVDLGGGVSQAIDNFFIACPPPTVCQGTNQFECEFPARTTAATTLSKVISETTLPWEEVVTTSSLGNATKEFSENYINTEKITTTAEYSVTTDATVDWTAINASELNIYNEMNTPEIEPTLAAEIATTAIETNQTVNGNVNSTEYVPTVGAGDITTAIIENVSRTTTESNSLTETDSVVVDDITATDVQTTTENDIITDTTAAEIEYVAPSATEQIAQTTNENMNITETVRTGVQNVTLTTTESKKVTETEPVLVDNITATVVETTTENMIITDTIAAEIDYIATSATEQVAQTINENLNITKTVPMSVENVTQSTTDHKNLKETEPVVVDGITATTVETTTENIIISDTIASEIDYIEPSATEQVPQTINENLNITETVPTGVKNVTQTTTESNNLTETEPVDVDNITIVETTTENIIITDTIAAETDYIAPSATEQVAQTINENLNITKTVPMSVENVTQSTTDNKNLKETEPVVVDGITATTVETTTENIIISDTIASEIDYIEPSATEQVPQTINENLNITETVPMDVNKDITSTIIETVTQNTAESVVLTQTEHVETHEITATTLETTTDNIITQASLGLELGYIEPTATEQVTQNTNDNMLELESVQSNTSLISLIEAIITTHTTHNIVTENIIPPSQAVNLGTINTDALLTTVTNAQSMPPAFEDNMKFEILMPITENIESTVNSGASTNGLMAVQLVNMDTITTEAVYIPTTISNDKPMSPDFEEVMKTEPSLDNGAPATDGIVSTVNNKIDRHNFMTPQVDLDTITMGAMFIPTTVSNGQAHAFKDITTGAPLPATENFLSSVNNGSNANVLTSHTINAEIINTEAMHIPNTINNAKPISPTFKDNIMTDVPLSATENILSSANNGASTNSLATAQPVNVDTINTEAMHIPTTITSAPPLAPAFEDNMNTDVPLPVTDNVVSSVNNGASTNDLTTAHAINVDGINTEPMYIPTTISSTRPIAPTFEENITTNVSLAATENILSSKNYGTDTKGLTTAQAVNVDGVNTDTMHIPLTITNGPPMAPTFGDNTRTETPLSALKNNIFPKKYEDSTNGFMIANPMDLEQVTQTAGLETTVQLTTDKHVVLSKNDVVNNVKTSSIYGDMTTKESVVSVPVIIKEDPYSIIQKTEIVYTISTDTGVKLKAIESDVNGGVGESISHVSNNEAGNTKNTLFLNEVRNNQNEVTSAINEVTANGKPTAQKENISQTGASPIIYINGKSISTVTTKKSIPTSGFDTAFDISNQNWMSQQGEIKTKQTTNNLQPSIVEHIDQADNNIWNPLANQVFNSPNQNPEPIGPSSVTNINDNTSATLNSQTRVTVGADISSQPSHVEKIPNKMASSSNNTDVIPRPKPSGSGVITNNPDNLHGPNSSNNVNTGIITPESVSESNYKSPKSENIMAQVSVIGYQKNNTTVVTGLNFTLQNVSFGTEKAPPNSTGSDHIQTQQYSSIFTPAQTISTSTARTPSQMATSNPISHLNNDLTKQVPTVAAQNFSCIYGIRGRYSDKGDCRKFYICIGNNETIVGYCPENTVFSDLKKLCTKNMSHCIRDNQFKCPSVGRFSDFMKDNVYYICVNHKNNLYRFKFQCQKGYILDKTKVKCIETKEIESNESVSISSDNSSQTSSSAISSSTRSKSISNSSSTSKSSRKADDGSSKNNKSRKSKKSNEAEETSEKSEGKGDNEDDEVFKCKEKGKFPIRNECSRRYYLCKKGRRSEFRRKIKKCDSDQVFNENKKKCVDEDSYEC